MRRVAFSVLSVLLLTLVLTETGHAQSPPAASSLFQCQPSSQQSGLVYIPNIPDFYFDHENLADYKDLNLNVDREDRGTTYVFTIPPESPERNCSGTVVAMQYCYKTRSSNINDTSTIFTFLTLSRNQSRFHVNDSFRVQASSQENMCVAISCCQVICCTNTTLDKSRMFQIPSSNYSFGLVVSTRMNRNSRLLIFDNTNIQYRFEHFRVEESFDREGPSVGDTFSADSSGGDLYLPVLRFLIEPDVQGIEMTTTTELTTNRVETDDHPSTIHTINQPMATELGDHQITTTSATGSTGENQFTNWELGDARTTDTGNPTITGGIAGAVAAGILTILAIVILCCILIVRRRISRKTSTHTPSHQGMKVTTNETYSTITHSKTTLRQQQDMELIQNQVCAPTATNMPVETNESYGITTPSVDPNLLYATVEGEHVHQQQDMELTQNQAYAPTATNIPVETNDYVTVYPDQLYEIVEGNTYQ